MEGGAVHWLAKLVPLLGMSYLCILYSANLNASNPYGQFELHVMTHKDSRHANRRGLEGSESLLVRGAQRHTACVLLRGLLGVERISPTN